MVAPLAPAAPFDLVLFDLDGTLLDTAPEICDAVNDTLAHLGMPSVPLEQVVLWIGHGTLSLLAQALAHVQGLALEQVQGSAGFAQAAQVFAGHYHQRCGSRSQPYPQVLSTLLALREHGVRLAVVTNKEHFYTERVLQAHGLLERFDLVVSGDTLPTKKPDPAGVQHCLNTLGVGRERALFVGDSRIDVATARHAQVAVWALPYGYNMGEPIARSQPDRVIADCSVLLADWTVAWPPAPRSDQLVLEQQHCAPQGHNEQPDGDVVPADE